MTKTDDRLVCIKIPISGKENMYDRVPRSEAKRLMEKNPNIRFASKSAHKKYISEQVKQENKNKRKPKKSKNVPRQGPK